MADKFPDADSPGTNTELRPDYAPEWLRPALDVTGEDVVEAIGERTRVDVLSSPRSAAVLMLLGGTSKEDATVLLTHPMSTSWMPRCARHGKKPVLTAPPSPR